MDCCCVAQDTLDDVCSIVEVSTQETGAESGTLFLNDETNNELYSRVAEGGTVREIRMINSSGVAGHVADGHWHHRGRSLLRSALQPGRR